MCQCPVHNLAKSTMPARASVPFVVVEVLPEGCHKACTLPTGEIQVQRDWWARFSSGQKDAALAHEMGHAMGARCEPCADFMAGAVMRRWGYSLDAAQRNINAVVRHRGGAPANCARGWRAAGPSAVKSLDYSALLGSRNTKGKPVVVKPPLSPVKATLTGATVKLPTPTAPGGAAVVDPGGPSTGSGGGGGGGGGGGSGLSAQDQANLAAQQGEESGGLPPLVVGVVVFVVGGLILGVFKGKHA